MVLHVHVHVLECSYVFAPPRFFCGAPDQGGQPGWVQHFIYTHTHTERMGGEGGGGWDDTMAISPFVGTLISVLANLTITKHCFFISHLAVSEP